MSRGHAVRYYSFREFQDKIEDAGAEFIACDEYLAEVSKEVESGKKTMSAMDMTVVEPDALNGLCDPAMVYRSVNQLEFLAKANVFLTHNGMNHKNKTKKCRMIRILETFFG